MTWFHPPKILTVDPRGLLHDAIDTYPAAATTLCSPAEPIPASAFYTQGHPDLRLLEWERCGSCAARAASRDLAKREGGEPR